MSRSGSTIRACITSPDGNGDSNSGSTAAGSAARREAERNRQPRQRSVYRRAMRSRFRRGEVRSLYLRDTGEVSGICPRRNEARVHQICRLFVQPRFTASQALTHWRSRTAPPNQNGEPRNTRNTRNKALGRKSLGQIQRVRHLAIEPLRFLPHRRHSNGFLPVLFRVFRVFRGSILCPSRLATGFVTHIPMRPDSCGNTSGSID